MITYKVKMDSSNYDKEVESDPSDSCAPTHNS